MSESKQTAPDPTDMSVIGKQDPQWLKDELAAARELLSRIIMPAAEEEARTIDRRPGYCLHKHHPDAAIEAKAREIYMAKYGHEGGWWELNETPGAWWSMAEKAMQNGQ